MENAAAHPWPDSLEQRFVEIDGATARVLVAEAEGAGEDAPTLVLVQPGGAVPEIFLPLIRRLAGPVRILAPDLPGHGTTAYRRAAGQGPHATLRRHVSRVLDACGVGPCVVAGSSLGAHVSISLALHEHQRVRGAVVFGSASTFASEAELHQVVTRHNRNTAALEHPASLGAARASVRRFAHTRDGELSDAIVWAQSLSRALPEVAASSARLFADLVDADLVRPDLVADRLGEVRQPVLVVWGRQDPLADVRFAEKGIDRLPQGRLVVLDDCGHLPYLEHADHVAGLVRDHLHQVLGAPSA